MHTADERRTADAFPERWPQPVRNQADLPHCRIAAAICVEHEQANYSAVLQVTFTGARGCGCWPHQAEPGEWDGCAGRNVARPAGGSVWPPHGSVPGPLQSLTSPPSAAAPQPEDIAASLPYRAASSRAVARSGRRRSECFHQILFLRPAARQQVRRALAQAEHPGCGARQAAFLRLALRRPPDHPGLPNGDVTALQENCRHALSP